MGSCPVPVPGRYMGGNTACAWCVCTCVVWCVEPVRPRVGRRKGKAPRLREVQIDFVQRPRHIRGAWTCLRLPLRPCSSCVRLCSSNCAYAAALAPPSMALPVAVRPRKRCPRCPCPPVSACACWCRRPKGPRGAWPSPSGLFLRMAVETDCVGACASRLTCSDTLSLTFASVVRIHQCYPFTRAGSFLAPAS